jgi:hypothetical protein
VSRVSITFEWLDGSDAVFRLEPPRPDITWQRLFQNALEAEGLEQVRFDGRRLIVSTEPEMLHEGSLRRKWVDMVAPLGGDVNAERKRLRDLPPSR